MSLHFKLLLTVIFWGATPTVARVLATYEAPLVIVCARFAVAAVFLLGFMAVARQSFRIKRRWWWRFMLLGITGIVLHNGLLFKGLEYTSATTASIVLALIAIQVVLLDWLIYRRQPPRRALAGVLLAFLGTLVVITGGRFDQILNLGLGRGEVLVFFSALAWAAYSVLGREVLEHYPALTVTTVATLIGVVLLLPALMVAPGVTRAVFSDLNAVVLIFLLGFIGSALGFLWYYEAVARIGTVGTVIYINLVPVFGVLSAAIFLGETLEPALIGGGVLVLAGVVLVNLPVRD